jgi:hypothetical protein
MKFVSVSALIYDIIDDVLTTDSDDTNYIISCHWVNYGICVHWENMVFRKRAYFWLSSVRYHFTFVDVFYCVHTIFLVNVPPMFAWSQC